MSATFEKARRGDPAALQALYEAHKSTVHFLSSCLLDDPAAAKAVTQQAFQNTWSTVLEGRIENEHDFRATLLFKVVNACKNRVLKTDPKAFHLPPKKNFLSTVYTPIRIAPEDDRFAVAMHSLPTLHRFIYVLHGCGAYNEKELGKLLNTNAETIRQALGAEEENLKKIFTAANHGGSLTVEELHRELLTRKETCTVPDEVNEAVSRTIVNICKPYREKAGKTLRRAVIGVICAAVVLTAAVAALVNHDTDEETADDTSSIVSETESEDEELTGTITMNDDTDGEASTADDGEELTDEGVTVVENPAYYADIEIENYGTVTVALDSTYAPGTVENFVELAQSGFYDGLTFHRIIEGFMMQGGDPNGDGTGGSDESITGEFTDNGVENPLSNTRGAIAMARSSDYDSASSQFFIVHEDSTFLDGQYAVFGYVTSGMDVVDAVCTAAEPTDDNGTISSADQPVITSVTIREPDDSSDAVTE